jgi:hypothetical protein
LNLHPLTPRRELVAISGTANALRHVARRRDSCSATLLLLLPPTPEPLHAIENESCLAMVAPLPTSPATTVCCP